MKHTKIKLSVLLLCIGITAQAQQATTAAGGDASGSGGTLAYSVGQVVYTTNTGTNGSVAQGVQHAYEISTTTGIKDLSIQLEMDVYPNPTSSYLNLKTEDYTHLSYQLYDSQGRVIETNKVTGNETTIEMGELSKATYFLKVSKEGQLIKTFKIIKK